MIVTEKDLKGKIADFPIEVVQKMVDYQEEQGYEANPSVFANNFLAGFVWSKTHEGTMWWNDVIIRRNFSKFFEKYPRKQTKKESIILINKNKVLTLKFNL